MPHKLTMHQAKFFWLTQLKFLENFICSRAAPSVCFNGLCVMHEITTSLVTCSVGVYVRWKCSACCTLISFSFLSQTSNSVQYFIFIFAWHLWIDSPVRLDTICRWNLLQMTRRCIIDALQLQTTTFLEKCLECRIKHSVSNECDNNVLSSGHIQTEIIFFNSFHCNCKSLTVFFSSLFMFLFYYWMFQWIGTLFVLLNTFDLSTVHVCINAFAIFI